MKQPNRVPAGAQASIQHPLSMNLRIPASDKLPDLLESAANALNIPIKKAGEAGEDGCIGIMVFYKAPADLFELGKSFQSLISQQPNEE